MGELLNSVWHLMLHVWDFLSQCVWVAIMYASSLFYSLQSDARTVLGLLPLIACAVGIGHAIGCFYSAVIKNPNPYDSYVDASPNAQPGTRRNYFFGPGYRQFAAIVKDVISSLGRLLAKLEAWKNRRHKWYLELFVWFAYRSAVISTFVLSLTWLAAFSAVLLAVLIAGTIAFFACFATLWCADRACLLLKSISTRCPNCKRVAVIPCFECPTCGTVHRSLTPGPYGVFRRKCSCGTGLPTTAFGGRSSLKALCPHCSAELAASDTRQFGIQLVGGTSAGKTTFLASFWHCYLDASRGVPSLRTRRIPHSAFEDLERCYARGIGNSTAETNANMYSVIHSLSGKTPLQFSIYDIAGEAFGNLDDNVQQQQFRYCEGVVLVIDPTSPVHVAQDALTGFLGAYKALKGRASASLSSLPAAVVISKSDLFMSEIGLAQIQAEHSVNGHLYADSRGRSPIDRTRDMVCRSFLDEQGFSNVMNLLEAEFNRVAVFPASAIGHEAQDGIPCKPWGVMEPVLWILKQADEQARAYFLPVATSYAESTVESVEALP